MNENTKLQVRDNGPLMEKLINGDLSMLSPKERVDYYLWVCETLGLNPATSPFSYLKIRDKKTGEERITLYAKRDCSEQMRKRDSVSITDMKRTIEDDMLTVDAVASLPGGRLDRASASVSLRGLSTEEKARAYMVCETKAKRRVTLSICGLGFTDESEVPDIPGAEIITPKPLQGWKCSQETAQRILNAGSVFIEKGGDKEILRGKFESMFPALASTRDMNENQAIQLAEAYEAMAREER
ncbi:MAG: hypothetical protein KGJ13_08945 [Patescibacteria group bacterium]|nr:hypothetical protein [Patescibacteria group bacterium]